MGWGQQSRLPSSHVTPGPGWVFLKQACCFLVSAELEKQLHASLGALLGARGYVLLLGNPDPALAARCIQHNTSRSIPALKNLHPRCKSHSNQCLAKSVWPSGQRKHRPLTFTEYQEQFKFICVCSHPPAPISSHNKPTIQQAACILAVSAYAAVGPSRLHIPRGCWPRSPACTFLCVHCCMCQPPTAHVSHLPLLTVSLSILGMHYTLQLF